MKKCCLAILMALIISPIVPLFAQDKKNPQVFYGRVFRSQGDTLFYRVLYPKGYTENSRSKYPLVVVLHGEKWCKEGQFDNTKQLSSPVAELFKRPETHDSFPAIVIIPQCEFDDPWAQFTPSDSANVVPFPCDPEQTYSGELTERLINYYVKHHPVDKNRIYMIGQGAYGGSGALDLAVRNPDMFAAVVSIGGAVCPDRVKSIKKLPVRLYTSSSCKEVPLTLIQDVYISLKMYGSTVEPIVDFSNMSEDECAATVTTTPDFLRWIFSKKK